MMSLTWISHFKFEETVMPSSLKEDIEISGGIRVKKQGKDLRTQISIIRT
jgi:hypothetical protein